MLQLLHKTLLIIFCCSLLQSLFAQDTLELIEIEAPKKSLFKKKGLYDTEIEERFNIRGFTQLNIFNESLIDFWKSEDNNCINSQLLKSSQRDILSINWNSDQSNCEWVGFGFGWDSWQSKDLGYVSDTLAIELIVRSKNNEEFTNLPWAFCIEDYSGGQAWTGYNQSYLKSEAITKNWTKIQIPLSEFPFKKNDVDFSNVKQLMIQTFATGSVELYSIKLVPCAEKKKKSIEAKLIEIAVDGNLSDWSDAEFRSIKNNLFATSYSSESVSFAFKVIDDSPRQNNHKEDRLWNGDAIEIAFSTNPQSAEDRNYLLLSDQHIGINCGNKPYIWNWKTNEPITEAKLSFQNTTNGYSLEISIPYSAFRNFNPRREDVLDLEIAIDFNEGDNRKEQLRWNSGNKEGFHVSPALWGELILN